MTKPAPAAKRQRTNGGAKKAVKRDGGEYRSPSMRRSKNRREDVADTVADRVVPPEDEEEAALRQMLFGSAVPAAGGATGEEVDAEEAKTATKAPAPKAAWVDSDDEEIVVNIADNRRARKLRQTEEDTAVSGTEYSQRLKTHYERQLGTRAAWAELPSEKKQVEEEEEDAEDAALLRQSGSLLGTGSVLPQGRLDVVRRKDANAAGISEAVVQSVHFHPGGQLFLTAGYDKRLRLFQIDGARNPLVQSVFMENTPIRTAQFVNGGNEVLATGRRPYILSYDIASGNVHRIGRVSGRKEKSWERFVVSPDSTTLGLYGNDGYLVLFSAKTKQWIADLKMNGGLRAAAFAADGNQVLTTGTDGEVYRWDLRMRRVFDRHLDEGSSGSVACAFSPDCKLYAVGADSGVVNVYDATRSVEALTADATIVKPLKTFMHLTSSVSCLSFNSDSNILAMSSQLQRDCLRLAHMPSMTVFANWPTSSTPLHYVSCLDFSPHSGYLSIGNDRGHALLYRLNHYNAA